MSACCASGQRFSDQQLSMRPRQSYLSDSCMFLSQGKGMLGSTSRWGADVFIVLYSSFCCSFFWKQTGKIESTASTPSTAREFQDTASPAVVSLYRVVPALIATNDGGATPVNQPGRIHVSQRYRTSGKKTKQKTDRYSGCHKHPGVTSTKSQDSKTVVCLWFVPRTR